VQRGVERLLYGERDPLRVASRVGDRLGDLDASLAEIRSAMRLPYVAVVVDAVVAESGTDPGRTVRRPLGPSAALVVGLRRGESGLSARDERVLDLLAGPLAVALHATTTSHDLQTSRERLVAAREEERLRLRRDLHDGLGPLLTGVALAADAAANLQRSDPAKAADLLDTVRAETRTAIAEVRRVVDDLRPPALAELGLAGALAARAARTVRRADGGPLRVTVDADTVCQLPAAIEVAAYRIATEALNNVVRHSSASSVSLRVSQGDELVVEVLDDGVPNGEWAPGVGLSAMRERAAELGGECAAGPSPAGGAVRARLPVVVP
jgi:signal transduction histidine kinase